ncbi:MAG: prepilin-type N-terminal cleavage/methylation domain-containing protein [Vulcanimicrobiota bacterium]
MNNSYKNTKAFSLMEVIIALAIALIMLTALFSLEIRSTALAARAIRGFEALPYAIERIEELTEQDFTGSEKEFVKQYELLTTSQEFTGDLKYRRVKVEVLEKKESYVELSIFKFGLQ